MQLQTAHQFFGHSFDEMTGQYLLPVRVYPESDGSCPLPDNTVDFAPTVRLGPNQAWRITASRDAWEVVDDFRGVMLWDTDTATPIANHLALGEPVPVGATLLAPLPIKPRQALANRWNAHRGAWELVPDYSHTPIWDKATGILLPMLPAGVPLPASAIDIAPPVGGTPVRFDDAQGVWIERQDHDTPPGV